MKKKSIFRCDKDNCLFPEQFDNVDITISNKEIPLLFKRLNKIDDDRSFVILATSIVENQIDNFLVSFIPNHKVLLDKTTNLNSKIKYIKAFNLIPEQFPEMLDLIKKIRNEFAHNLRIDSLKDLNKSEKTNQLINQMCKIWEQYKDEMTYWDKKKELRLLFKDICNICIEGLMVFEFNVKQFRSITEKKEFILKMKSLPIQK